MRKSLSIIIALSISLFVYLFYRSEKTVVNELAISVWSLDTYRSLKETIRASLPLPRLVVYSLPGGLWLFCVTLLAKPFYLHIRAYKLNMSLIPLAFAIGLEICQLLHITRGRFDSSDILAYTLFWLFAHVMFFKPEAPKNICAPFTLHSFVCLACMLSVYLAHVNI